MMLSYTVTANSTAAVWEQETLSTNTRTNARSFSDFYRPITNDMSSPKMSRKGHADEHCPCKNTNSGLGLFPEDE